ncbi:hypothetical protein [Endozoicomonas sp. 8E]|uniref:hypothetical protein n=1 Tax=Endozoicomonas sp. 8E TaxID=3035692 RepID=UPI0029394E9D|nr:hypothetical protein [Endozoicomonas sp. 8E]WOG26398.1 hypothetical protein P6910_17870 [Endozoicomonas sp. 8E]
MTTDSEAHDEQDDNLTPEELRSLKQAVKELNNPVRYVVYSQIIPDDRKFIRFLDITSSTYGQELSHSTLFKKYEVAKAVADVYSDNGRLRIAKVTTKGDKLRVVRYNFEP